MKGALGPSWQTSLIAGTITVLAGLARRREGDWLWQAPGRRVVYAAPVARVVVEVMLKPEIHDPQGEAIASACHRLGFGQVTGVRQGKRFEVELSEPAGETMLARVAELAGELLANPVIEEFSVRPA
jgi:phosphoribosylformylglycinamidine synthase